MRMKSVRVSLKILWAALSVRTSRLRFLCPQYFISFHSKPQSICGWMICDYRCYKCGAWLYRLRNIATLINSRTGKRERDLTCIFDKKFLPTLRSLLAVYANLFAKFEHFTYRQSPVFLCQSKSVVEPLPSEKWDYQSSKIRAQRRDSTCWFRINNYALTKSLNLFSIRGEDSSRHPVSLETLAKLIYDSRIIYN